MPFPSLNREVPYIGRVGGVLTCVFPPGWQSVMHYCPECRKHNGSTLIQWSSELLPRLIKFNLRTSEKQQKLTQKTTTLVPCFETRALITIKVRVHTVFSFFVLHWIKQKRKSNFVYRFSFFILSNKNQNTKNKTNYRLSFHTIKHNTKYERLFFSQTPISVYHSAIWNWKYDSSYRLS